MAIILYLERCWSVRLPTSLSSLRSMLSKSYLNYIRTIRGTSGLNLHRLAFSHARNRVDWTLNAFGLLNSDYRRVAGQVCYRRGPQQCCNTSQKPNCRPFSAWEAHLASWNGDLRSLALSTSYQTSLSQVYQAQLWRCPPTGDLPAPARHRSELALNCWTFQSLSQSLRWNCCSRWRRSCLY